MDPRELATFIRRWKGTILLWSAVTFLGVAVLVFWQSSIYLTHATVLVDRTQAPIGAPERFFSPPEAAEALNTEINVIRSRPVIEAVVDRLKLTFRPAPEESSGIRRRTRDWLSDAGLLSNRLSPREQWITRLSRGLEVRPVVDSNILTIGYESTDARLAPQIVNSVTDEYIARRLSINASKGASEFYLAKLDDTEGELRLQRTQLDSFRQKNSLNAVTENKEQLVEEAGALRFKLSETETELRERLTRFAERHPSVILLRQEISATKVELATARKELQRLETEEAKTRDMQVRIETLEANYVNYQEKLEEAKVRESATQGLINVRVVEYATVPEAPKSSRLSRLIMGAIGSLLVGLLIASLRQYLDRAIRSEEQVEKILSLPVYGSVGKYRP